VGGEGKDQHHGEERRMSYPNNQRLAQTQGINDFGLQIADCGMNSEIRIPKSKILFRYRPLPFQLMERKLMGVGDKGQTDLPLF